MSLVSVYELPGTAARRMPALLARVEGAVRARPDAKRVFDVVASALLLAVLAPFLFAAILAIEAGSPGSGLYVQWRVGRRGRLFRMVKLRTMVQDAEVATGPVWARQRDARVTFVGRLLRETHLDELPQLWNVLRGDMSLVGPRPERPVFVHEFARTIPNYSARHEVRPGISGLAQIRRGYDRDVQDVRRKLVYDLLYIRRMSLLADLRILLLTIGQLVPTPRTGADA